MSSIELVISKGEASELFPTCLVATGIFLFLHQLHDVREFFWDANDYWAVE